MIPNDLPDANILYLRHNNKSDHTGTDRYGHRVRPGELPHHVLIFKLVDQAVLKFKAFCAGSIITQSRVLTSANCFLTNRKRHRHDYNLIWVAAGVLKTTWYGNVEIPTEDEKRQWRRVINAYSQRFYRFPAYNLGILEMDEPWIFNTFVNLIPYESVDHDFDGVCISTSIKATKSWSHTKYVYTEELQLIPRKSCEKILQRSCRFYFCTEFANYNQYAFAETEGGGLICHVTGDPKEVNVQQGILVGVTSIINIGIPSLHHRIGKYAKWVDDKSFTHKNNIFLTVLCITFTISNLL